MHGHIEAKITKWLWSKTQTILLYNNNKAVTTISKSFFIHILKMFLTENVYYTTANSLIHECDNNLIRLRKFSLQISWRVKYRIQINHPWERIPNTELTFLFNLLL